MCCKLCDAGGLNPERLMLMQPLEGPHAQRQAMRPAEPARVVGIEYFIAGEQQTWMRLRLALADESSALDGRGFTVDLPSPETDFGDFVILRSRWDAAMQQHWRVGDECQVGSFQRAELSHACRTWRAQLSGTRNRPRLCSNCWQPRALHMRCKFLHAIPSQNTSCSASQVHIAVMPK